MGKQMLLASESTSLRVGCSTSRGEGIQQRPVDGGFRANNKHAFWVKETAVECNGKFAERTASLLVPKECVGPGTACSRLETTSGAAWSSPRKSGMKILKVTRRDKKWEDWARSAKLRLRVPKKTCKKPQVLEIMMRCEFGQVGGSTLHAVQQGKAARSKGITLEVGVEQKLCNFTLRGNQLVTRGRDRGKGSKKC
ncbi:hypothetical protein K438DRAFT_1761874 [Mycena galopus ATCC 62051]|nr:hypothetical protein K438DRAFT_1761874 [Mycena galopus ATCC 62051]